MKTSTLVVIDPDEINLSSLASVMNDADIECGIDDDEIYILGADIDSRKKLFMSDG